MRTQPSALASVRLEDNPRYQAAKATSHKSGPAFQGGEAFISNSSADGWLWAIIAALTAFGLAVVGLA